MAAQPHHIWHESNIVSINATCVNRICWYNVQPRELGDQEQLDTLDWHLYSGACSARQCKLNHD